MIWNELGQTQHPVRKNNNPNNQRVGVSKAALARDSGNRNGIRRFLRRDPRHWSGSVASVLSAASDCDGWALVLAEADSE